MAKKSSKKKAPKASKKKAAKRAAPAPKKAAKKAANKKAARKKPSGPTPEQKHEQAYAAALELFHKGRFTQALKRLEAVAEGPDPGLRHNAQMYAAICRQRTGAAKPVLKTAEDLYNYAVKLINDRELDDAETYLKKALKSSKKGGHIYYALALAAALREDVDGAYENLSLAIQADPQHRIQAKVDSDFSDVRDDERIADLLTADD